MQTKRILRSTFLPLLVLLAAGCSGTKQTLQSSPSVPTARGEVKAKEADNGNTALQVNVEHLARPGAVASEAMNYVVWAKDSQSGQVSNLGALKVDDDLSGELNTVTPLKNFEVFVTPEDRVAAMNPSGEHLLWAHVSMD